MIISHNIKSFYCIFSVESYSLFINVGGFKQIQSNVTYTLYVDESIRCCRLVGKRDNVTIVNGESYTYDDFKIPEEYRPSNGSISLILRHYNFFNYVYANGTVGIYNAGSTVQNYSFSFIHEWHY